jgi:hypothetical protein
LKYSYIYVDNYSITFLMVIVSLRGNSYDLSEEQLFKEISRALENTLGDGSAKLVFNTLKLVYGIDYEISLSSKFESFEQSLKKLIGEQISHLVIKSIVSNLQRYIVSPGNGHN